MAGEQNLQRRLALIQSKKKKKAKGEKSGLEGGREWDNGEEKKRKGGEKRAGERRRRGGRGVTKKPRNHVTLVYESR